MWNPYDFTGKRIIVTGATSGIGKATAVKLAEQGAEVVLIGRNEPSLREVLNELQGKGHSYYVCDLSQTQAEKGIEDIYNGIVSDGHKIDGLAYCAGTVKIVPAGKLSKKTMDESMTTNLYSFVEMAGTLSKKKYHDQASVVGVSSISALYPQKCQGGYVASKAAMNAVVASMAIELAEKGIRINTIMPASTNTRMLSSALENKTKEEIDSAFSKQVLGLAEPEDIADIILFLLSDASRMITGRAIFADAGFVNL